MTEVDTSRDAVERHTELIRRGNALKHHLEHTLQIDLQDKKTINELIAGLTAALDRAEEVEIHVWNDAVEACSRAATAGIEALEREAADGMPSPARGVVNAVRGLIKQGDKRREIHGFTADDFPKPPKETNQSDGGPVTTDITTKEARMLVKQLEEFQDGPIHLDQLLDVVEKIPAALTAALDRAEKAKAVDDSCMDTAHIVSHRKGWNEAIEAAAKHAASATGNVDLFHSIQALKRGAG